MIMVLLETISPLGQTRNARRSPERIKVEQGQPQR